MAKTSESGISAKGGATDTGGGGASAGGYATKAGWAATGPNGTLSKGDIKDIKEEIDELTNKANNGKINDVQWNKGVEDLKHDFGISDDDLHAIIAGTYKPEGSKTSSGEKKTKKQTSSSGVDASKLPGINGNDFQPSANAKHLKYEGGDGLGIWNQLGGGVKNGGVNSATAKKMNTAVESFTGSGYGSIRAAQASGDTTSAAGKKGVTLEKFISKAVETGNGWSGGPTYRGMDYISDTAYNYYANLKAGDLVDANHNGSASWSTNANTSFMNFSGGHNSVVFVNTSNNQPMGVSVDNISTCKGEKEVLVSKDAKFKVQHVAHYIGGTQKSSGMSSYTDKVGKEGTDYLLVYVTPE